MASSDTRRVEALIQELDLQRKSYIETFEKVHELLTRNLAASAAGATIPRSTPDNLRLSLARVTSDPGTDSRTLSPGPSSIEASSNSKATGEDSDEDDDEVLYVQTPLAAQSYSQEGLREHLRSYRWDKHGRKLLDGVAYTPDRLSQTPLVPNQRGALSDRSHYTDCQVFDVGPDGSPLLVDNSHVERESGRAMAIWTSLHETNPPSKQRHAVGRITVLREPSPILFGVIHHTMNNTFVMDELFQHLYEADLSSMSLHRAFDTDVRKQRTFVFNFEYFTLIGKECQPMKWQLAAGQEDRKPGHIAITRCSSVVALALSGPHIKEVKNPARRKSTERGYVYDPFSPWQVLNVQCYPDWKASSGVHDSTKHYVNGVDAFLHTLLAEFRDARRRFVDITKSISRRVRPPLEFMFDSEIRDKLLFEDDEFTMARRYFWAHQTLGIMNESIKAMIDAYEENFTNEVWEGKHKTLWPLLDGNSARSVYYKKKMAALKTEFETEILRLRNVIDENNARRVEIGELREDLFTGTSIQESRKSVTATETTVQQGHNIKVLTLVSIFFLPLTFVTSVFGMTNMPTQQHYWAFAIVTACVCVPFFVLIGSLNTSRGMKFWRNKTKDVLNSTGAFFGWVSRGGKRAPTLYTAKSFESQSTGLTAVRRWSSSGQKLSRAQEIAEPSSREEQRMNAEGGRPRASRTSTGVAAVTLPPPTSNLASMWYDERRRRLTYSEEV